VKSFLTQINFIVYATEMCQLRKIYLIQICSFCSVRAIRVDKSVN